MVGKARAQNLVVIGAEGFIGRSLLSTSAGSSIIVSGTTRRNPKNSNFFDLESSTPDDSVFGQATAVLILAANSKIAECENNPEKSYRTNVTGVRRLVEYLDKKQILPVFFSTDYVFDGESGGYSASSPPDPRTQYGSQKFEAERIVREVCGSNHLIIRLSKVYGTTKGDGTLLDEMANQLVSGITVRAATDIIFSPTHVLDVVRITLELIHGSHRGTYHVCAPEAISRFDLAAKLANALKVSPGLVQPIKLSDIDMTGRRPKNTSLIPSKISNGVLPSYMRIDEAVEIMCTHYGR